ncbi:MAG: TrkA C-terminal domain-containing protein, partial [Planctomycetales bacterium]
TCAELYNREYGGHLELGHVNDYVLSNDQSALLLAQAALNRSLLKVFGELLTHEHGNQFYSLNVPEEWAGQEFSEMLSRLKQEHGAILIAVRGPDGDLSVNPGNQRVQAGDEIIYIAEREITF